MSTPLARLQLLNNMRPDIEFRFGRSGVLSCLGPEGPIVIEAETDQLAFARMTEELEEQGVLQPTEGTP